MLIIHEALARIAPEFSISEPEARTLSVKFCDYANHYSLFTEVDPKTRDFRLFLGALALMEGPRVYRVINRRAQTKAAAKAHAEAAASAGVSGIVVDFNGMPRP